MCIPAHLHLASLHLAFDANAGADVIIPACEAALAEYERALTKALSAKHQHSDLVDICHFQVSAQAKLSAYRLKYGDTK